MNYCLDDTSWYYEKGGNVLDNRSCSKVMDYGSPGEPRSTSHNDESVFGRVWNLRHYHGL